MRIEKSVMKWIMIRSHFITNWSYPITKSLIHITLNSMYNQTMIIIFVVGN